MEFKDGKVIDGRNLETWTYRIDNYIPYTDHVKLHLVEETTGYLTYINVREIQIDTETREIINIRF